MRPNALSQARGFSLLELMIGLGVGAVVSLSGAYVAVQSTKVSQATSLQTELNQEHIVALQRLKDTDNILNRIGQNSANVNQCFSKRNNGFNCASLNMPDLAQVAFDFATCDGATCNFDHTLEYRLECANSSTCSKLELKLTTVLRPAVAQQKQYFAKDRVSHIYVSGLTLSSRAQIDFSCSAGNRVISALSFNTLRSVCDAYVTQQVCAEAGNPLQQFGNVANCQTMAQENCGTYGFTGLGLFRSHSACNAGGTGTFTPPPPPDRCESAYKEWTVGGNTCSGWVGAENVGSDGNANDNSGPTVGRALYDCQTSGWVDYRRGDWTCENVTPPSRECTLPWGGTIPHGESVTAYGAEGRIWGPEHSSDHRAVSPRNHRGSTPCEASLLVNRIARCSQTTPQLQDRCWISTERTDNLGPRAEFAAMRCRGIFRVAQTGCLSEQRTCNDGVLSGSYNTQSCGGTPPPPPPPPPPPSGSNNVWLCNQDTFYERNNHAGGATQECGYATSCEMHMQGCSTLGDTMTSNCESGFWDFGWSCGANPPRYPSTSDCECGVNPY